MISRTSFLILTFLFIVSCGHQKTSTTDNQDYLSPLTVDINQGQDKSVPKIEEKPISQLGPKPLDEHITLQRPAEDTPSPSAIILGPGVYRTISHISLLRELNEEGEKPNVILGHGLASIIAAYYAYGYKPDYIEWKFFKFFNELDGEIPFSKEWIEFAKKFLIKELEGKRIEGGKLTLIIPVWNESLNKVVYLKRGDLHSALVANIDHKGILSKHLKPAFTYGIFDKDLLINLGIKRIYAVDLLTEGISWKRGDGFFNGVYEKGASLTLKEENKFKELIKFNLKDFKVDDLSRIADLVYLTKNQSKEKVKLFKKEEKQ